MAFSSSWQRPHRELPSYRAFLRCFRAFRARWPRVVDFNPWNEVNHWYQPTYRHPRRTAGFYNAARRACPRCNVAAGDLLDSGNLARWLARYRPHLRGRPRLWSLHNYLDVNYLRPWRRSGTRGMLRLTRGRLWISETAGIVYYLRAGRLGERHAANATRWMLALPARSRRITRVYASQWQAPCHPDIWDSAWFRSDGSSRPSFRVLVAELTRERRLDPDAAAALNPPALAGGARHLRGQAAGPPPYPAAAAATSFSRVISGSKRGSLTTVTPWSARSLCTQRRDGLGVAHRQVAAHDALADRGAVARARRPRPTPRGR